MGEPIKILLTGFAAPQRTANVVTTNASEDVVRRLKKIHPNAQVVTAVLPQSYQAMETQLKTLIAKEKPDFVICLGQSESPVKQPGLRIEVIASSQCSQVDGLQEDPARRPGNANEVIHCRHPAIESLVKQTFARHFPDNKTFQVSNSAGNYLCEDAFYTALVCQRAQGKQGQAIFLHLDAPDFGSGEDISKALQHYSQRKKTKSEMFGVKDMEWAYYQKVDPTLYNYAAVLNDLIDQLGTHGASLMQDMTYQTAKLPPYSAEPTTFKHHFVRMPDIFPFMDTTQVHAPLLPKTPAVKQRQ